MMMMIVCPMFCMVPCTFDLWSVYSTEYFVTFLFTIQLCWCVLVMVPPPSSCLSWSSTSSVLHSPRMPFTVLGFHFFASSLAATIYGSFFWVSFSSSSSASSPLGWLSLLLFFTADPSPGAGDGIFLLLQILSRVAVVLLRYLWIFIGTFFSILKHPSKWLHDITTLVAVWVGLSREQPKEVRTNTISSEGAVLCQNANDLLNWQPSEFLSSRLDSIRTSMWVTRQAFASFFSQKFVQGSAKISVKGHWGLRPCS